MPNDSQSATSSPRSKLRLMGIGILLIIFVIVMGYMIYQTISTRMGALVVESEPAALVYINGEQKGKTPFEVELNEEEVTVKLVPDGTTIPLLPYETHAKLAENVKTIVRRKLGESKEVESGQIISFEKRSPNETSIAVVSNPDGVEIFIDGEKKGVTPLKIDATPGRHSVKLSAVGYIESSFEVQTVKGYALTAIVDLAKNTSADSKPEETKIEMVSENKPSDTLKIKINDTPLGYLRVRAEASASSEEIGRVIPDEEYEVLDHNEEENWYKIAFEYDDEQLEGWVSGDFVTQLEDE